MTQIQLWAEVELAQDPDNRKLLNYLMIYWNKK